MPAVHFFINGRCRLVKLQKIQASLSRMLESLSLGRAAAVAAEAFRLHIVNEWFRVTLQAGAGARLFTNISAGQRSWSRFCASLGLTLILIHVKFANISSCFTTSIIPLFLSGEHLISSPHPSCTVLPFKTSFRPKPPIYPLKDQFPKN